MLIGGYAALYLIKHGLTIADISFLKAFQGLVIILIQVPIGVIIDRRNNRYPFILISLFLAAIWMFLTAIGDTAFCFFTAELFNGLSLAIFNAVMLPILVETYSYETGKDDYNYTLGKFFKYQNLLMAISVILGSIFVKIDSNYVWFAASFSLIVIGLFSLLANDVKKFNFISTPNKSVEKTRSHFSNLLNLIKAENIIILFIANISLVTVFQILAQFWQVIIYDYLNEQASYALVYGFVFAIILILQAIGSSLAEKKSSLKISLICMVIFITITSYLMMSSSSGTYTIIPIVLFLLCFILFKYPSIIISALLHQNISNDIRATFDSLISMLSMVLSIVAFYLIGILLNNFGNKVIILSLTFLTIISFFSTLLYLLKIKYGLKSNAAIASH
ncbi:TPA: MFS transporter [Legionella pneumophila]|nr:MFS transporter [Legionella pneumophila]HDU8295300.1 MFS transporter [Legionella pneumophila]